MTLSLATLAELGAMLITFLVASLISAPLRAQRTPEGTQRNAGHLLLERTARPLIILVLSLAAKWALGHERPVADWIAGHAAHLTAWMLFWECVLALGLIEGVSRAGFRVRGREFPLPDLLANIIRGVVITLLGFGVLKYALGVEIAALLGTTALLTAVIGFALQGVLGNLLAGMSLHVSGSLLPGDWIDIGDAEGRVTGTTWRETRLRTVDGHMLIVPNSKVADAIVHNMVRPTSLRRHQIDIGASYSDAPDEVIAALKAAAAEVSEVQRRPAPEALVTRFEDFGISYNLRYWTSQYSHRQSIDGEVCRHIWYKFKRAGIEIPFPMSDKLLSDFMDVVYHQRTLRAGDEELAQRVDDLMASKLHTEICVDGERQPLLGRADWAKIVDRVDRQLYTRGETLYRQDEKGDSFHVVVRGSLKVIVAREGDKRALELPLAAGDVVGEMSLITGLPRAATIEIVAGSELLEFDAGDFRFFLTLHDQLPAALADLAERRKEANSAAFEALAPEEQQGIVIDKPGILQRLRGMIGLGPAG